MNSNCNLAKLHNNNRIGKINNILSKLDMSKGSNLVESLNLDEINYLQSYLENIKRIKQMKSYDDTYIFTNRYFPGTVGSTNKMERLHGKFEFGKINDYYNPYEYGAKQNSIGQLYNGIPNNFNVNDRIENKYQQNYLGQMKDINIENLLRCNIPKTPGQRSLMETEINRFEQLPFNPQDTKHIIWEDNMPRGGYATRSERLEY